MSEPDITTTTPTDFDTIEALAPSWYLSLRSRGRSPRTIKGYKLAAEQLSRYLQDTGTPIRVSAIKREHVEAYIVNMFDNRAAATARQRYASLQQFFKWLLEEGEITRNP
ncbi:MAG: phage integrase N-terminal SAM-like domain-containing protein, partial [Acidimicrobiia bacterium]